MLPQVYNQQHSMGRSKNTPERQQAGRKSFTREREDPRITSEPWLDPNSSKTVGGTNTVKPVPELLPVFNCNSIVGYILKQFFSPKNITYDAIYYNLSKW